MDEDVWTGQQRSSRQELDRGAATAPYTETETGDPAESDEIRQGAPPEDGPELGRRRSSPVEPTRIPLFAGRTVTLAQLAGTVASLVVAAFLAGLFIGHGTRSGPRNAGVATSNTVAVTPGNATGSTLPTEPSFTILVAAPNPLPRGSAGPKGNVTGSDVYALQLASSTATRSGQSMERRDAGALTSAWSLIVRRSDGSLGRHSSVVTYPVVASADLRTRTRIRVGPVVGHADGFGGIVWPIGGKYARIRGDLGQPTLAVVAGRVSLRHGRPVIAHPPTRFHVVAAEPYRSLVVTESRYDSLRVSSGPIDGLIFTDVLRCASFEEALYVEGFGPGGNIGGHPAVLSSVGGGNATLAWEPTPGSVVFVGYSGGLEAQASGATLIDLARGGRLLDHRQWTATHPSIVKDTNAYS